MECRYCGAEFEPKKRGRKNTGFCCKKCADNWRQHNVYDLQPRKYTKVCEYCGEQFETNRKNQKYCSQNCSNRATRAAFLKEVVCDKCGRTFVSKSPSEVHCPDCSVQIAHDRQSEKKQRRRQMIGDSKHRKVKLSKVYETAGGICAICGLPVPLSVDSNDEWSATRDHIVPISKDGEHSYSNCQLAHRICNSSKRDNGYGWSIDWQDRMVKEPGIWDAKVSRLLEILNGEEA